jgi:hypothetical protein
MTAGTLVLAKNADKDISTYKSIGTVTGFHPTLWLGRIEKGQVALFEDPSPRILVQYLVKGLIDGLVIDLAVATNELQKLKLNEQIIFSPLAPQQVFAYKLSTVKYPEVMQQFNQWQVQKREFIQDLKYQFGISAIEPKAPDMVNN